MDVTAMHGLLKMLIQSTTLWRVKTNCYNLLARIKVCWGTFLTTDSSINMLLTMIVLVVDDTCSYVRFYFVV